MAEIPVKPQGEGRAKSKTWVWWIIAAIVVILLYFLFSGRSHARPMTHTGKVSAGRNIASVSTFCPPAATLKQAA